MTRLMCYVQLLKIFTSQLLVLPPFRPCKCVQRDSCEKPNHDKPAMELTHSVFKGEFYVLLQCFYVARE